MAHHQARFRPDIEGLRAVAVGLVVLGHAGVPGFAGGYIGVDVFFVISGFLITSQLLRETASPPGRQLLAFYARRARRILPVASLVLVVTVLATYHWLGFLRGQSVADDGRWTALFAANLHFASQGNDYLRSYAPPSPLQHYWSLGVEEQFYLAWPAVVLCVMRLSPSHDLRRSLLWVLVPLISASFVWSVIQTRTDPTWAYFSPLTRGWELGVGALLAVAPSARLSGRLGLAASWFGLAAIVLAALTFDARTAFPGYAAALPVLGTVLLLAAGPHRAAAARLLGLAPFQLIGRWSFAFYLWHWPLLTVAAQRAGHPLSVATNLQIVFFAIVLACITHYAVENPVRFARPLRARQAASVFAGAACALLALGVCQWQIRDHAAPHIPAQLQPSSARAAAPLPTVGPGVPDSPGDVVQAAVASAPTIDRLPTSLHPDLMRAAGDFAWLPPFGKRCLVDADVRESPPCEFGDVNGARTLVLLGDSHIAMWLGAFDEIGLRNHMRVILLSKTGCSPLSEDMYHSFGTGSQRIWGLYEECFPWLQHSLDRIAALGPVAVVISSCSGCEYVVDASGNRLTSDAWREGMVRTLTAIAAGGAQPILLGDIPRLPGMLDCLALHQRNVQACSRSATEALATNYNDADRAAASEAGSTFIDPVPWFCSALCTGVVADLVPYTNDYHVTATYAAYLRPILEQTLLSALGGPDSGGSSDRPGQP